jgi:hypothetical protein
MASDAATRGQILGVRRVAPVDEPDDAPWNRPPSGPTRAPRISGPIPPSVNVVFAQRLFVEKVGMPSALLNQIQRLAAFQNPEFYKKQAMRLSTALTPRIVSCAEDLSHHIALPRGCKADLEQLLKEHGSQVVLDDQRHEGERLDVRFQGQLTAVQERAARALLADDIGVFVAPPGIGKTVLGTYLIAERGRRTLVLVHRQPLLDQWAANSPCSSVSRRRRLGGSAEGSHERTAASMSRWFRASCARAR